MKGTLLFVLCLFCLNVFAHDIGTCISALVDFKLHNNPKSKEDVFTLPTIKCNKLVEINCPRKTGSYQLENKISGLPYNKGVLLYTNSSEYTSGQSFFVKFPPVADKKYKVFKFSIEQKKYCGEVYKFSEDNTYNFKFVSLDSCEEMTPSTSINLQDEGSNNIASDSLKELLESEYNEMEKEHFKDNLKVEKFSKVLSTCRSNVPQHGQVNDVSPIKNTINLLIEKMNTKSSSSSDGYNGSVSPK